MSSDHIREAWNAVDTAGVGKVEKSQLQTLIQKLSNEPITKNDVLYAVNEMVFDEHGMVSYSEFKKWHQRCTLGHHGARFNKLLVRDLVGKGRTSSYNLPAKDFTYGYVVPRDVNGAKEVIGHWDTGKARITGSDLLKSRLTSNAPRESTFGRVNRPSTPIDRLVRGEFGVIDDKEEEYPIRRARAASAAGSHTITDVKTRNARDIEAAAERGRTLRSSTTNLKPALASDWKMKKFANVKSKMSLHS